jgi:predicted Rossmann-fold nucleotide-binding protein
MTQGQPHRPFDAKRETLYTTEELMAGFDGHDVMTSLDQRIQVYLDEWKKQRPRDLDEGLAQREHDYRIEEALQDFIAPPGEPTRKVVGIMGSHNIPRSEGAYKDVVHLAWRLSTPQDDYTVLTGGGLGIMEAASLGAYLAPQPEAVLDEAIGSLGEKEDAAYIHAARELRSRFPEHGDSIAVPTWSYSHEPISQFSSHIAKHFENSSREEGLLAVAIHGVIYAPGGAGTLQEIFQDAAQNTYWSFKWRSPMIFLGKDYFTKRFPAYQLLMKRAEEDGYADMVGLCDTIDEVIDFLHGCEPRPMPAGFEPQRAVGRSGPGVDPNT